ncbi:hypothetical protein [Mesorhizobium australicum]|nr:hypothetical protein [Mesorhizobium australicum]
MRKMKQMLYSVLHCRKSSTMVCSALRQRSPMALDSLPRSGDIAADFKTG